MVLRLSFGVLMLCFKIMLLKLGFKGCIWGFMVGISRFKMMFLGFAFGVLTF
jgi:hypothetical protein